MAEVTQAGESPPALITACAHSQTHIAAWLLSSPLLSAHQDADVRDIHGATALWHACHRGDLSMVAWLHARGAQASVNIPHALGKTPLHVAAGSGNLTMCRWLLNHGATATLSAPTSQGFTPLATACWNGHLDVAQLLYDRGAQADVRRLDKSQRNCMHIAAFRGHLRVAKWVYCASARDGVFDDALVTNAKGQNALWVAVQGNHLDVVAWLLEVQPGLARAPPPPTSTSPIQLQHPIQLACSRGQHRICEALYKAGGPGVMGNISPRCIDMCGMAHPPEMLQWLVSRGAGELVPPQVATQSSLAALARELLERHRAFKVFLFGTRRSSGAPFLPYIGARDACGPLRREVAAYVGVVAGDMVGALRGFLGGKG